MAEYEVFAAVFKEITHSVAVHESVYGSGTKVRQLHVYQTFSRRRVVLQRIGMAIL